MQLAEQLAAREPLLSPRNIECAAREVLRMAPQVREAEALRLEAERRWAARVAEAEAQLEEEAEERRAQQEEEAEAEVDYSDASEIAA